MSPVFFRRRAVAQPAVDADLDRCLIRAVDASFAEGAERAGDWCACRPGCTACCLGPFPITELDAWRLREALRVMAEADPDRASRVRRRARAAIAVMGPRFPDQGDDEAEEAFCARHDALPCPALDPETGRCDLYDARPISCRTYGPPVRIGDEDLPPCDLWFDGAPLDAIERARVEPDPGDLEGTLLAALGATVTPERHTSVAHALLA